MGVYHACFELHSGAGVHFHEVTAKVQEAVAASRLLNGLVVVYSQHTTCSVMLQEESHDQTYHGTKFLLQDMVNLLEKVSPTCRHEGQYLHPGPQHIDHATKNLGEEASWSLNTDAHLRSALMGRSETIPLVNGKMELGEFGQVYFIDFDQVRNRRRNLRIQIVGE
ncbi:MAG: YjbQ family protein [Phycisphaerales bacterium]|nr:YjbQ family protein [Phycisphaerales bacterium]